ncbi:MAG: TetR/AcrR family transcriptional regulator [Methanoregula sp.]|nr:TetR/AcrR family transcriptional regulator [Methanoregula sp.]
MPRINTEYRVDAKKKIIAAALDVAATSGWGALTLDAIAQKVGVTKGAFYSYFKNSSTLMQDVIIEMIRIIRDHILVSLEDESDIHAALDRTAGFIFLQPKPFIPVFIQAISVMPEDPVFREKISGLLEENSSIIVAAFARFQESGQIPDEVDLPSAVRAIYAMTIGLGLMTHVLGKDAATGKRVWIESVERILIIEQKTRE